jgi:hypothetical protein
MRSDHFGYRTEELEERVTCPKQVFYSFKVYSGNTYIYVGEFSRGDVRMINLSDP